MKKTNLISISLSVALISAMGLSGCGSSSTPITKVDNKKNDTLSVKKQGYNTVSGKITLNENPNSRTRSLSKNQAEITAYNLTDNSTYKTKTDNSGKYELSGLTDGEYQIFAVNNQYAKNSVRKVTLKKGTRAVVDFSLTAAGSIKGKIAGANFIYIPGTDHVSVTDSEGNFELTGVPVGTYTLMYEADHSDQKKSVEVTIEAGTVTALNLENNFDSTTRYGDDFGYINTSLKLGVLQLHHEGIPFRIHGIQDGEDFYRINKYISLKNSAGEEIPFIVDFDNYNYEPTIRTIDVVPAGEYTLTFAKEISDLLYEPIDQDRVYTFNVKNVSVAQANTEKGTRLIQIYLPTDITDEQKTSLGEIKVVEKGTTDTLAIKQVWSGNQLSLFGSFKTGVEYEIQPTDAQSAILGSIKFIDGKLIFGDANVEDIYPKTNSDEIRVDQNLYVNIKYANQLDPSTVKFTLNSVDYKGKDILFDSQYEYDMKRDDYISSRANISFKHDKLEYGKDYTLTFSAKDMSGNNITKTTTFKTMTPSIVDMSPNSIEDLFDDVQQIEFNVPVDKKSGTITVENLTDNTKPAEIKRNNQDYGYYNPQEIFFSLKKLTPNQRYKITASGFKDKDGHDIPTKTTEFSTPPKMLFVPDQYSQNINVTGENFSHKVNLFFFGGLTDAEKSALEENLQVKSYGQVITPDATHPTRKLFFTDEDSGTMLTVAFTIDPNTNYELVLNDASGLSGIVLPDNTKLVSFATVRKDNTKANQNAFRVIERLDVQQPELQEKYNDTGAPSMKLVSNIDMDVNIPLGKISNYESCWNRFEYIKNDASNLIRDSLHVSSDSQPIDVQFKTNNWDIVESYENNEKICYLTNQFDSDPYPHKNGNGMVAGAGSTNGGYGYELGSIASFEADYNKTYQISLDFTDSLDTQIPASSLVMNKTIKTNPVGTMEFSLVDESNMPYEDKYNTEMKNYPDEMNKNMIIFNMHSNAPVKTDNLDSLFQIKVNGENFTPEYNSYNFNDQNKTTDISFAIPRTLYSLLQLEISKIPGQNITFVNPLSGEEVINNSAFNKPLTFTEDVAPDLVPVKVKDVHTTSIENNEVIINFNRPVNPADIASVAEDGTISDIALEVKSNDGTTVAITGIENQTSGVGLKLAEDLNTSKTYTISLKDGESIKAAFGAQELKEFSQDIPLTYVEVGEMMNIAQQASLPTNPENPYILGSTNSVDTNYKNSSAVVVPLKIAQGATVNIEKSSIMTNTNAGAPIYDAKKNLFIQPLNNSYVDHASVTVAYTANGKEFSINKDSGYLNPIDMPFINSFYGNGANAITFSIANMDKNYQITPANFIVYNSNEEVVDANVTVQFDTTYSSNTQPTVTFGNLEADSIYAVDIVGIPSYDGTPIDLPIDKIYIKTPAQ